MDDSIWDVPSVKTLLRLTSQKLGQIQDRKDAQSQITRRDIATLLQQDSVGLARAKAQNLIEEDAKGDLLELLEMYVGMLLEHFGQLEQSYGDASPVDGRSPSEPSPIVTEAASSIIFAAPHTESKELNTVRDILIQRLGPDFARAVAGNRDNYVPPKVISALSTPPPSAAKLDDYLLNIAKIYRINWEPDLRRQDTVDPLSEIMDPELTPVVDLPRLRKLCLHGIPDEPAWLRPRLWKLLLGFLPVVKSSWSTEHQKYRESYYDLIRRLLLPIAGSPPPSKPPNPSDSLLLAAHKHLLYVAPGLFAGLDAGPEDAERCPLDPSAPEDIRIACATALDNRLAKLLTTEVVPTTPEIRLEPDFNDEPSTSTHDSAESWIRRSTTLLPSKPIGIVDVHPKHASALLRLLYLHCSINPGTRSPYVPSLLVPMYAVMCFEVEPRDVPHIEADTFWLFEAMLGEFSELEDEEGGRAWTKKLSERLAWADQDLSDTLDAKGLDPALPHYSYRWLAPILTQTLPLSSFILVWDALFACAMRDRQGNPKIEHLLDICTAMLVRARKPLFHLGKGGDHPGLWGDENDAIPPPPLPRAWEFEDAFRDGVSLLQNYPIEAAGGIERILQTAAELSKRRIEEMKAVKSESLTLGERLRVSMWKGFTNQVSSPNESPERSPSPEELQETSDEETSSEDDGNVTERPSQDDSPAQEGITSRLATTVWRGITNQSSMEPPPSPLPPPSPSDSAHDTGSTYPSSVGPDTPTSPTGSSGFWKYAEKLKDSDTVATLSKVSSNWRAKSLLGSWGSRSTPSSPFLSPNSALNVSSSNEPPEVLSPRLEESRRGSLPPTATVYSPPPRPAFFRQPRDSFLPHSRKSPLLSLPNSPENTDSESGTIGRGQRLQASLMALTGGSPDLPRKSGPRPLLLGSSSVITASPRIPRSTTNTPAPEFRPALEAARNLHRDSQSSISSFSLSPAEGFGRAHTLERSSGWDSDTLSRVVPLNRKSVSPMAPGSRILGLPASGYSSASDRGITSPALATGLPSAEHGWTQVDSPTATSAPKTPASTSGDAAMISVMDEFDNGTSLVEAQAVQFDQPSRRIIRKKTPPPPAFMEQTSDSSSTPAIPRSNRVKSRRSTRPGNLRLQEPTERRGSSPNSLVVDWPKEHDLASTPKASNFEPGYKPVSPVSVSPRSPRRMRKVSGELVEPRPRKLSAEISETRVRKVSTGSRGRKTSTDKDIHRKERDSAAEEGDDEGYDDLLSAYESEGGYRSAGQ